MLVSYFQKANAPANPKGVDVSRVLNDIKSGKYKKEVSAIRLETNKDERTKLKKALCGYTFAGTFTHRAKDKLKKSSGLAMLDFDDIADVEETRKSIDSDQYTFSSFVSPSGNGLKVLVRIPPVANDKTYKEYYHEIQKHFNKYAETDISTTDISRFTYTSYDSNLYLNIESKVFTDKFIAPERPIVEKTNIPLTDQNEVAERLEKWFKKRYTATNRNTNLHAFARQFNAFGVDKYICKQYLLRYEESDFKEREILSLINSAYKYTAEFGTSGFEDTEKVRFIKNSVLAGSSESKIKSKIELEPKLIEAEIEKHKSKLSNDEFWYYTEKGAIQMSSARFRNYLHNNNISKYYPSVDSGYLFIKKDTNFIKEFDDRRIKDFVLNDLETRSEIDAFELCADNLKTFKPEYLGFLKTSDVEIQRDTKTESFLYYKNTAVKITKDNIELIPYSDIKGLVWEKQVIDRDYVKGEESKGEFQRFLWLISGRNEKRYYAFKSAIGYLIHGYQNQAKPKVVIFNDEMISDGVSNGGSGKTLINMAIGYLKNLSILDGKTFDPNKQFAFQTVSTDTQIVLFDDIRRDFKFENLFSVITGDFVIEKKGKDAIKIPFEESPKIAITTNYTVKGEGSSHYRRVFELEASSYFNDQHTPEDEFGHLLFNDWDDFEWQQFDNFMIRCVKYYLENGLVEYDKVNLEMRKLIDDTNSDFIEFMDSKEWNDKDRRWEKTDLKDLFIEEYEDYKFKSWFTSNLFNKWVKKYTDVKKLKLTKDKTNGVRYIIIYDEKTHNEDIYDDPNDMDVPF